MFRSCELCQGVTVEHPQEHLVAGGLSVCVDRQLVPLLRMCWSLGLLTYASCEDYLWSGRSLLEFLNAEAAQDFLSRVLQGPTPRCVVVCSRAQMITVGRCRRASVSCASRVSSPAPTRHAGARAR